LAINFTLLASAFSDETHIRPATMSRIVIDFIARCFASFP